MNKAEFVTSGQQEIDYKFIATLLPPLMKVWLPTNPETNTPYHAQVAVELGLAVPTNDRKDQAEIIDKPNFRSGYLRIRNGEITLRDRSITFRDTYPSIDEFASICRGVIEFFQPHSS